MQYMFIQILPAQESLATVQATREHLSVWRITYLCSLCMHKYALITLHILDTLRVSVSYTYKYKALCTYKYKAPCKFQTQTAKKYLFWRWWSQSNIWWSLTMINNPQTTGAGPSFFATANIWPISTPCSGHHPRAGASTWKFLGDKLDH